MSNQRELQASADFVNVAMQRGELLELLAAESRNAQALAEQLDASRSTVHRVTETLEEFGLVEKPDESFAVTGLGAVVAEEVAELRTNLEIADRLEPFLNTVDTDRVDVPLECFAEARVTAPQQRQAHVGVKRIIELIEGTDSLRMFSSIISPLYVDVARREILEGTEIEVVFDREVVEIIASRHVDEARDALETGRFHVLAGEGVPFELFLFDDRMGMAAHDGSGIARAFVESSSPEAREWAESLYREYADAADTIDLV